MVDCELECRGCGAPSVLRLPSLSRNFFSETGGFLPQGMMVYGRGFRDGVLVAESGAGPQGPPKHLIITSCCMYETELYQ